MSYSYYLMESDRSDYPTGMIPMGFLKDGSYERYGHGYGGYADVKDGFRSVRSAGLR